MDVSDSDRISALLDRALDFGISKCLRDGRQLPSFPHVTRNDEWLISDHGRWTAGFFVGMLWIAHLVRDDPALVDLAYGWTERLRPRAADRSTHDLGFLFEPSFIRGYNITKRPNLLDAAVEAARSLASRFHPLGHFIPAWSPKEDPAYAGLAIVDTIMNVPLILWGSHQTGDAPMWKVGKMTAATIGSQHVRVDGSTYHTVAHDPETGDVTARGTHQGAHAESCWTRGQAWALYGFTKVGRMLESDEMIGIARLTADHFLDRLGDRSLPPWDFERDAEGEPLDSAAGAIAASGLLELFRATNESVYADAGRRIAVGLVQTCIDFDNPNKPGLLMHGTVDYPRNSGIDESIIYGDHYFMEALVKLRRPELWDWLGC